MKKHFEPTLKGNIYHLSPMSEIYVGHMLFQKTSFLGRNCFYKKIVLVLILCTTSLLSNAQEYHITNKLVERNITCSEGHISSRSYKLSPDGFNFLRNNSLEFSFLVNDSLYSGFSLWKDFKYSDKTSNDGIKESCISFKDKDDNISVKLLYITYPDVAAVRKFITIKNCGKEDIKIENLDIESLNINMEQHNAWTYQNFARDIVLGQYLGNWNDPLVLAHDYPGKRGIAVGNESIAVLKRTETFANGYTLKAGLTENTNPYPFRVWLAPGESWTSPAVFTVLYENKRNPKEVVNSDVQTLVRKYMGTQIEKRPEKPMLVYNTWEPFLRNVNEKLILELAHAAAECGAGEFVIDDGWQINLRENKKGEVYADWGVDTVKFPHGLKPVFDTIKSLGMKPGLWISIAYCFHNGEAYSQHPEWIIQNNKGEYKSLHSDNPGYNDPTACMATDWSGYIRDIILGYVKDNGLAYVKLDLAIVTSAYIFDTQRTGCYATNHKYHKDHNDSYYAIFDRCMKMFDELHEAAPELFIDCTFETAGKLQLMDYGISEHADGNWLSNFGGPTADASLRVRNIAWRRTPVLHPTSLVIGNLRMDSPNSIHCLKSLAGTLPIMLGDPRKLSPEQKEEFRKWSNWLNELQSRHGFMSYRQDLKGFDEPMDGMWDGFSRINTETKTGGLIGIFRENAVESIRTVTVDDLETNAIYLVKKGCSGEIIAEMKGSELSENGFKVEITDRIGGELFEITKK